MHTLTAPPAFTPATTTPAAPTAAVTATLSPAERLHALDNLLHGLWAHEPDDRFGARHHLLDALRQLSIEVERLAFRQSFRAHVQPDSIDQAVLDDCTERTAALVATWSTDLWVGTPWPAELLGARIAGDTS